MATIVTRAGKGSALTHNEVDANFNNLNNDKVEKSGTDPVVISVNSSSDALRITQTGAGNALVVEDSTNPDSTPFVVGASGNVGIGTSSPGSILTVSAASPTITLTATTTTGTTIGNKNNRLLLTAASVTLNNGGEVVFGIADTNTGRWGAISGAIQTNSSGGATGDILFATKASDAATSLTERARITSGGDLLVTNAGGGLGYGTGAGGTVVQATNKSTAVTLNKPTGSIQVNGASLAADTAVSFTFNNSLFAVTDTLVLCNRTGGTAGAYWWGVTSTASGSCVITIRNMTTGSLSQTLELNFTIIKGVTS
jgi:hypothetical protein